MRNSLEAKIYILWYMICALARQSLYFKLIAKKHSYLLANKAFYCNFFLVYHYINPTKHKEGHEKR